MTKRMDEICTVGLFCLLLGLMLLLLLFLPKQRFSEREKRYLTEAPALTAKSVFSGAWGEQAENYLADHLPGRDFFVGLNAYADLLSGRQAGKEILMAEGGRLVEAPLSWDEVQAEKNLAPVRSFAEKIAVPVDFMLVPSAGWAAEEELRGMHAPYEDEKMIADLYSEAGEAVNCVTLCPRFAGHGDWFFKTDHHWNSRGAYEGFCAYLSSVGRPCPPESDYDLLDGGIFCGSTWSRSALWLTAGDELELWQPRGEIRVTNAENGESHEGVFYLERLEEADKYTVNLDGNHSLVRTENPTGEGKLLVIRDSFSNSLGTFLAGEYETVVLVDLRYYRQSVSALLEQEDFDRVLVCYSLSNFLTDTNLSWLR